MSFWADPAKIALLKQCWAGEDSASKIAAVLGTTRNAVIGKVNRLGLEKRGRSRSRPRPIIKPRRNRSGFKFGPGRTPLPPKQVPAWASASIDIECIGLPLVELEQHHCRWPLHEPDEPALFCGAVRFANQPYCAGHCRMAYRPLKEVA